MFRKVSPYQTIRLVFQFSLLESDSLCVSQNTAIVSRNKARQKQKQSFSMVGMLYSFSNDEIKLLRMLLKKKIC